MPFLPMVRCRMTQLVDWGLECSLVGILVLTFGFRNGLRGQFPLLIAHQVQRKSWLAQRTVTDKGL